MVDATRSSVPGRELAALGRGGRASPMLAASVMAWRRDADGSLLFSKQSEGRFPEEDEVVTLLG